MLPRGSSFKVSNFRLQFFSLYHHSAQRTKHTSHVPKPFQEQHKKYFTRKFVSLKIQTGNDLVGTIPPSLGNLSSLQNISLARNHLVGSIPRVLGRLSNLKKLNLGLNNLSGVVPDSLYNLSNIQILALDANKLSGTFPSKLQLAFPHLRGFLVGGNQFDGTFPSSISNITGLERFDISSNGFSGPIPLTLGSLNKLQLLHIGYNSFGSGRGRDLDFLSSLTNCTQVRKLILDGNGFGGEVPVEQ
ncbi:probable LRR receptor-like serine/threonine-protein kinase At3g47570 [Vigna umbellata]|uniref:probable LRR receptor-like serine/threonine-protein kinase At3g47570 n=1 Tax=Vigna umbellata TaxID=87088 RepID=UPI001F5F5702|nr:probable LRR receptor-like serine/threonine-protein kinase At3g47570 [Vigna umbellata]